MHSRSILPRYAVGLAALAYCALVQAGGLFTNTNYLTINGPQAVVMADLRGDGKLDAVELATDGTVAVYLGNGDGTFRSPSRFYAVGTGPEALAVADLNHDGKPDIVVANLSSATVSVLLGN